MTRLPILAAIVLTLSWAPVAALGQADPAVVFSPAPQSGRASEIPVIGWLSLSGSAGALQTLRDGLRELGYVEGQNIAIEARLPESPDEYPALVAELVGRPVDLIVSGDSAALDLIRRATSSIPVVMVAVGDPVAGGFVESLEHPGGNFTGTTGSAPDLFSRQLQVLTQAFPEITHVAALTQANHPLLPFVRGSLEEVAPALGLQVSVLEVGRAEDLARAFEAAVDGGADGLWVARQPITNTNASRIAELATQNGLPGVYPIRTYAAAGGVLVYGVDGEELARGAVTYVDKILKGANPAELPVQGPTRFRLIVNLKAAQELGRTIPQSVLEQATEVME